MCARGFDPATIRDAKFCLEMGEEADSLCELVREAFANVELGEGIGLFEGRAIDDYETAELRYQHRNKDEKQSWERIQSKHLEACSSSLSFFDALGMRFHLPAFIIADLQGKYGMGMEFTLTYLTDESCRKFELLNLKQRQVIIEYLQFIRKNPESKFHHDDIDYALKNYWK